MIKKILTFSAASFSTPIIMYAQITNPIGSATLEELLLKIIEVVILISVPIIVLAVIYSGFLFVTAGGNETKLTKSKVMLMWTLVGAAILLGAEIIAEVVEETIDTL